MGDDHFLERPGNSSGVGRMGKDRVQKAPKEGTFPRGPLGWVTRMSPSRPAEALRAKKTTWATAGSTEEWLAGAHVAVPGGGPTGSLRTRAESPGSQGKVTLGTI